jgi:cobalt-zinc-cadmium efflux system membrane fusion protein
MRRGGLFAAVLAIATTCAPVPDRSLGPQRPPMTEAWLDQDEVTRAGIAIDVAAEHDVNDLVVTPARVAFDENRVTHIFTPVAGQIRAVYGRLGEHVAKGFTLAVIASPDVGQATSDLHKARADLIAAEHVYERRREEWPSRATTLADLEMAQDNLRTAQAEEERAARKVALLRAGEAVSQMYDVKSPIAGSVLARSINPGLQVQGIYNGGTSPELFTVGDLEEVWVFSALFEQQFARVHLGARAGLSVIGVDRPFDGFVDWVSGSLDPQTRTATLRCVIENRGGWLKPEMLGTLTVSASPLRALAIPREAIVHLGGTALVFLDRGLAPDARERFERVPVRVDEDGTGYYVPVFEGVLPGDRVVTRGMAAITARM